MSIVSIRWIPKDALDGMQLLEPLEELAYRRIIDLIYVTEDNLPDDDARLARITKTGRQWKKIKKSLIEQGKIEVSEHKIVNRKCSFTIQEAQEYIEQKRTAGKASVDKRKQQKNNNTVSTDVITQPPTDVITAQSTDTPTEAQPALSLKPLKEKEEEKENVIFQEREKEKQKFKTLRILLNTGRYVSHEDQEAMERFEASEKTESPPPNYGEIPA